MAAPKGKSILYFCTNPERLEHVVAELAALPECQMSRTREGFHVAIPGYSLCFLVLRSPSRALQELHHIYFNLVVLDLRETPGAPVPVRAFEKGMDFLTLMDQEMDVELRYSFRRILALVSSSDSRKVDEKIRILGTRGVGAVLREPFTCEVGTKGEPRNFARDLLDQIIRITGDRKVGSMALCAAGGGITGIYFEMGALKCLSDCLSPGAINSFDMYFGISAGAVVTGAVANGYSIEEFMASIAGVPGGRIPPVSFSLLQLPHINLSTFVSPIRTIAQKLGSSLGVLGNGEAGSALESVFLGYSDFLRAPFKAEGFEKLLHQMFSQAGATNNFKRLKTRLYIGATDQDARTHVLFGDHPYDDVPISRAIEASISINPVFSSTLIKGRYYTDGAVTRTSDFTEAIRKGATLIFALDPFVPYVSKRPGFAHQKGALFHVDQDIRTVTYTRFETTRHWVLRQHPEVSLYTFLPANRLRKVMSVNPMDHRPYLPIWKGAYLSTLQRLTHLKHRMAGDLSHRGLTIKLEKAEAVAARLEGTNRLAFNDFFPEGKLELAPPPRILKLPAAVQPALQIA